MRVLYASLLATAFVAMPAQAVTLLFNDFSSTAGLKLNGVTATANDSGRDVLRVTPSAMWQAGSVFSLDALTFGPDYGFSTRFTFNFNDPLSGGADGLVFTIQPAANNVGSSGGGIGYQGIDNSLGVEFDNWFNPGWDGSDPTTGENHVGININGDITSIKLANPGFALDGGGDITSWIDYDGTTLEVRVAKGNIRPTTALLTYDVDLAATIGSPTAFVGFTSGTGSSGANHDLVSWEFRDTFAPIQGVPEPATWAMLLIGFGMAGAAMRRRAATVRFA